MSDYGWLAGFPASYGEAGSLEGYYAALRSALGNVVPPEDGLEDLRLECDARALETASELVEVAIHQFFAEHATIGLDVYRELYAVPIREAGGGDGQTIRELVLDLETGPASPSLAEALAAIHPGLSIGAQVSAARSRVVMPGHVFDPWQSIPARGGDGEDTGTALPLGQFHDRAVVRIFYALQAGETAIPVAVRLKVDRVLADLLPADHSWELYTGAPFYMDGFGGSYLDNTRISP